MKNGSDLGQSQFDALLSLLSDNRDEAGTRYESIRRGLIRYFDSKGLGDPGQLADTTFTRVAAKADTFDPQKNGNIESFIFGFASYIVKEAWRASTREQPLNGNELFESAAAEPEPEQLLALRACLDALSPEDKRLILEYHRVPDGREKAIARQKICEALNLTQSAFYTKISRIKDRLRRCIQGGK